MRETSTISGNSHEEAKLDGAARSTLLCATEVSFSWQQIGVVVVCRRTQTDLSSHFFSHCETRPLPEQARQLPEVYAVGPGAGGQNARVPRQCLVLDPMCWRDWDRETTVKNTTPVLSNAMRTNCGMGLLDLAENALVAL